MAKLRWARLREATAAASAPALQRAGAGADGDEPDADDEVGAEFDPCTACGGTGIQDDDLCSTCDGMGVLRESTSGPYWAYEDDPQFEKLREASRTFSTEIRKRFASRGIALPDGSYPIPDEDALKRAISAYGRNPTPTVKSHIVKRARALGKGDLIPDNWQGKAPAKESGFDEAAWTARMETLEGEVGVLRSIREAKPASMTPTFSTPTRVRTSNGLEGYRVVLIREGKGNLEDDQWYIADAIQEMCESKVCEGMQAFGNHPDLEEEQNRPERDVKELVGTYHDVKFVREGGKVRAEAIFVPLTYDEQHPRYGWVVTLAEAATKSTAPQPICGISLYGLSAGDDGDRPDGSYGRMVNLIRPQSGDIVTNAGAGGGFIRQLMESQRALRIRNRPTTKEQTPMKVMAYQKAMREAARHVREAASDEDRDQALTALEALENEQIDESPSSIEALREAVPGLVAQIEETVKAEDKQTIEGLQGQLKEARHALSGINDAIGVTAALHEAGVEDKVELQHYAGMANQRGLRETDDIKAMVETDRAFQQQQQERLLDKMRESIGDGLEGEVEGAVARIPVSSLPSDGGAEALRESGLPIKPDAE